jgi:hypothetical protein
MRGSCFCPCYALVHGGNMSCLKAQHMFKCRAACEEQAHALQRLCCCVQRQNQSGWRRGGNARVARARHALLKGMGLSWQPCQVAARDGPCWFVRLHERGSKRGSSRATSEAKDTASTAAPVHCPSTAPPESRRMLWKDKQRACEGAAAPCMRGGTRLQLPVGLSAAAGRHAAAAAAASSCQSAAT